MDKYHIYEEIGKGEFSQVFKGREKKKIEYVAIKRVDKSIMPQIVNEVQIMHKFSYPHILKFYDWYETRNNLWLIVEYCTGNDLLSLIKKDGHLPEESVRMFGLDILSGLKYLHSQGILHCDLQPKNILIDEYGILKISDFKLARKVLKTPEKDSVAVGADDVVSAYVALEVLTDRMHSYAEDIWALGCILYHLRRGSLPFGEGLVLSELQDRVLTTEPIYHPVSYGSPHKRGAPRSPLTIPPFTPELADLLLWMLEKLPVDRMDWGNISSHPFWGTGLEPPESLPPQPVYEEYAAALVRNRAHSHVSMRSETDEQGSEFVVESKREEPIARDDADKENVPSPFRALDSLSRSHGMRGEAQTNALDARLLLHLPADSVIRPIVDNKAIEVIERLAVKPNSLPYHQGSAALGGADTAKMSQLQLESYVTLIYKHLLKTVPSSSSKLVTPSISPTSSQMADRSAILGHLLTLASSVEVANLVLNTDFLSLLLKLSRSSAGGAVRPSSVNVKNTTVTQGLAVSRVAAVSCLAIMLRYATFVQPPSPPSTSALSRHKSSALSGRTAASSRVTTPPVDDVDSILGTLQAIIRETSGSSKGGPLDTKLRRRAVAAMGELMFYISSQEEEQGSDAKWSLPSSAFSVFVKCLFDDDDEPTSHYIAKTVENILASGDDATRRRFLLPDVAFRLLDLALTSGNPSLQSTCATAVAHYFSHAMETRSVTYASKDPSPMQLSGAKQLAKLLEKCEGGAVGIAEGLRSGDARHQLAFLTLVNITFASLSTFIEGDNSVGPIDLVLRPARRALSRAGQMLPTLIRIIEQGGSPSLRGKAIICTQLLCRYNPSLLAAFCERRFPQMLLRSLESVDEKDSSAYVRNASLSMLQFARDLLHHCTRSIAKNMRDFLAANTVKKATPSKNGSSKQDRLLKTPDSGSLMRQTPPSAMLMKEGEQGQNVVDSKALVASLEALRAVAALSSLPSLRRHIVEVDAAFIKLLRELLVLLPQISDVVHTSDKEESKISLVAFERATMVAVETVSNIDLEVKCKTMDEAQSYALLLSYAENLLPAVANLTSYPSGEVRVVLSSYLRRLLPNTLRAIEALPTSKEFTREMTYQRDACVKTCLLKVKRMFVDAAPIPQYALRMLVDMVGISDAMQTLTTSELIRSHAVDALVQQLGGRRDDFARVSNESPMDEAVDPQIALLLHSMFKSAALASSEEESLTPAHYMLARGLGASLDIAFLRELNLLKRVVNSQASVSDLLGLTSVVHLTLDCLELSSSSSAPDTRQHLASMENINTHIFSLLTVFADLKSSASVDKDIALEMTQLQALCCMCLSLHLRHFVEAGFRVIISHSPMSPMKKIASSDSDPMAVLTIMLIDQSTSNDQVCNALIGFLSQLVKLILTMSATSKLRLAVRDVLSRSGLDSVIKTLSSRRDMHSAEGARKLLIDYQSLV